MGLTKLKAFMPPKIQFRRRRLKVAILDKWIVKHGGKILGEDGDCF
jgi:hypothetical protein